MLSYPRKGTVRTDAPDMVRVQLKPNDIRSYRRSDVDEILKSTPGAFILGDHQVDDEEAADESETGKTSARSRRSASTKVREPKTTKSPSTQAAPAQTKSEPPAQTSPATTEPPKAE